MADESRGSRATEGGQVPAGALSALLVELAQSPPPARDEAEAVAFPPGTRFGRFEIVRELGRGGFGVVYEALDRELGRRVAFKVVRTGPGSSTLREERLLREAEAAARLSHPNLVTLHDVGRSEAGPFLVLELLHGRTLAERLDEGLLALPEAIDVAVQVARGLAWAHAHGVVHRDLKPANVFLCEGGLVKILDFGLAHAFGQPRVEGGTPAYMAPEQWRAAPEDERTDVFALGVMLYRMLAGEVPFPGDRSGKALLAARTVPALEVPDAPGLGDLATRMLAHDPVDRPRNGGEVLASLEAIQERVRAEAPLRLPSSATTPSARLRRAHPVRWGAVGALATLVLGGAAVALRERGEVAQPARAVVAVADVQNATGDPELDGISGLLSTALEQSRQIGVVARGRLVELARRAGGVTVERIDEATAAAVGRKAGATAILVPSVNRLGSTYALEVRAVDARDASDLFTLREAIPSKEGILPSIDRVSDGIRRGFREGDVELAGHRERLDSVVTPSLDAYRHYFLARAHLDRVRLPEAVAELERALAVDPRFALAHYQLAQLGGTGEIDEAKRRTHQQQALRLSHRLPARERGLLLASSAYSDGRQEESEQVYRALARDHPDDREVLLAFGWFLLERERAEEALPYLARAMELDPTNEFIHIGLSQVLGFLGRGQELVQMARRVIEVAPGQEGEIFLAEASLWAGDAVTAAQAARRAVALGEPQAVDTLLRAGLRGGGTAAVEDALARSPSLNAHVAVYQGRMQEALRLLEAMPLDRGGWAARDAVERLHLAIGLGDPGYLRAAAERVVGTGSAATGAVSSAVAWAGEPDLAREIASALPPSSPNAKLHRAVQAGLGSGAAEVLPALRELAGTHVSGGSFLDGFFLGEAALRAGRPEEAAEALRRFLRMNLPTYVLAWARPRALLLLARAEEARGRRAEAAEAADALAATWSGADPGLPLLGELAALRTRLGR